jgi:hypothetical protein
MAKKRRTLGCLFYIALVLLVLVVFLFNRGRVQEVLEKTGFKQETQELFKKLEPFEVMQFARSGRVALSRQRTEISTYLKELAKVSGNQ